ncbi:ABC transporter permease [Alteribacillus sp. HJP-4]|uniref:ABC transporter permease n=1 Tax=Alteribacillus sp. HJP-4 TaxID=2775394 RepID=UPI0035CCFFB0
MIVSELWNERSRKFWNEAVRYLRLVGNSGFMFSLYALFLGGSYFYPSFLEWLPASFPTELVLSLIFTYLLTRTPVRTFLKEADIVFLLPLETKMSVYFRKSVVYSFIMQSAAMLVLFLIMGPLLQDRIITENNYLYFLIALIMISNAWNFAARWAELRVHDSRSRFLHAGARAVCNAGLSLFLFTNAEFWYVLILMLLMAAVYCFYYYPLIRGRGLKWDVLIEEENKRLFAFYRFVQSFTDVPQVKASVKRRAWLMKVFDAAFGYRDSVYLFLYRKAFVRSGDYFGTYARLLIVGGLVMYAFPADWARAAAGLLFLYMTAVQLKSLRHHLDTTIWPDLYPVPIQQKLDSMQQFISPLLFVQAVLFFAIYLVIGSGLLFGAVLITAGLLLSWYYPEAKLKAE